MLQAQGHTEITSGGVVIAPGLNTQPTEEHQVHSGAKMGFAVVIQPNNQGHLVGPGPATYLLDVLVAAENCRPILCILEILHAGKWTADETTMLRDFAHMKVNKILKVNKVNKIFKLRRQWRSVGGRD